MFRRRPGRSHPTCLAGLALVSSRAGRARPVSSNIKERLALDTRDALGHPSSPAGVLLPAFLGHLPPRREAPSSTAHGRSNLIILTRARKPISHSSRSASLTLSGFVVAGRRHYTRATQPLPCTCQSDRLTHSLQHRDHEKPESRADELQSDRNASTKRFIFLQGSYFTKTPVA